MFFLVDARNRVSVAARLVLGLSHLPARHPADHRRPRMRSIRHDQAHFAERAGGARGLSHRLPARSDAGQLSRQQRRVEADARLHRCPVRRDLSAAGRAGGAGRGGRRDAGPPSGSATAAVAGGGGQRLVATGAWRRASGSCRRWRSRPFWRGTALLGWSFGLGGAPLNSYPPRFFPRRRAGCRGRLAHPAGTRLDGGAAAGRRLRPGRLVDRLSAVAAGSEACSLALAAATVRLPPDVGGETERRIATNPPLTSGAFWTFAAIAVLYAFAEGTFSNWAVIYLREAKGLPAGVAALALSVFWGAMVAGRLLVAVLVVRIAPLTIWLALPVLMIAAFLLLPGADTRDAGAGVVRAGGAGLLGLFPADHHPGVGAVSRARRLGVVHVDRRADGWSGAGLVPDRFAAGMAGPGKSLPLVGRLSRRGRRAGSVAGWFAATGGGRSRRLKMPTGVESGKENCKIPMDSFSARSVLSVLGVFALQIPIKTQRRCRASQNCWLLLFDNAAFTFTRAGSSAVGVSCAPVDAAVNESR
ncbi:MAG: hypothetical protein MZV63_19320 [Marinilabiliales bacterium]|nr:hypothetical protein [Marinilabiliales bacterium]